MLEGGKKKGKYAESVHERQTSHILGPRGSPHVTFGSVMK